MLPLPASCTPRGTAALTTEWGVLLALPQLPFVYVVFCFLWVPHLQSPDVRCF